MKILSVIALFFTLFNQAYSQSTKLDTLLQHAWAVIDSKEIKNIQSVKQIIGVGSDILPTLAAYFRDSTLTTVYSRCQATFLTRGEVAMIIADRIEMMPYARVIGIQNCLLQFCANNDNRIEYYIYWIRNNVSAFQKKYFDWLKSKDRRKWTRAILSNN